MKKAYSLIFDDEDLIIVDKSPGFLSIPDRYRPELPNLYGDLQKKFDEVFIIHRLDKETSGIICFAKNAEAHRHISLQFENRKVKKVYLALVEGTLREKSGIIDKPIAKSQSKSGKMIIHRRGKASETHYKVLEEFRHFSLVEAEIKTGRQHQIRVHFQAIGHPLAVDSMYNNKEELLLSQIKARYQPNKAGEERPLMARTSLHSWRLEITSPTTGQLLSFEAPAPKDLSALLKQLRKWGV